MQIVQNLAALGLAAAVFLSILCAGRAFLSAVKYRHENPAESIIFSFSAGAVILSLLVLALGKAGFLNATASIILLAAVIVLCVKTLPSIAADLKNIPGSMPGLVKNPFTAVILLLMLPRLVYAFAGIFLPSTSWDTLAYHYAIPAMYAKHGSIFYIPFMYHSNWPQNMETLFSLAMAVAGPAGDTAANGISLMYSMMLLLAVYCLGKRLGGVQAGIIAAAIMGATPLFEQDAFNGYVDLGTTFFTVAAFTGALSWLEKRQPGTLAAAAMAAGGAASVKILGLFPAAFLPFFIAAAAAAQDRRDYGKAILNGILFGVIAAAAAFPWYLKSFLDTGNPVWPFAYDIFGGRNWSAELALRLKTYYSVQGAGSGIVDFLKLPVTLLHSSNMGGYIGNNVIFYVFLFPYVIYRAVKERDRQWALALIYGLAFLLFWFKTTQMIRFIYPGFAVFTALCAAAASAQLGMKKNRLIVFVTGAFLTALLLYSFPFRHAGDLDGLKFMAGAGDREAYLEKNQDYYALYKKINSDPAIDGKIVLLKEIRGYYLRKDYVWGDPVNQGLISYRDYESTLSEMKAQGIKYALINGNQYNEEGKDGYTGKVYEIIGRIAKESGLLYCENGACLYRLK